MLNVRDIRMYENEKSYVFLNKLSKERELALDDLDLRHNKETKENVGNAQMQQREITSFPAVNQSL